MAEDFENYRIEDDEEKAGTVESANPQKRKLTMWTILPQVMIIPATGWENAREYGPSPELATIRFLLPLCLLTGASAFLSFFYPQYNEYIAEGNAFTIVLVNAVIQFCAFFIGYYLALVMAKVFLPKDARGLPSTKFGKLLTMSGVATLAVFHILNEALPMLDFILVFLPLWTIFIIFRGMQSAGVSPERSLQAIGVMCLVVIACPTIIEWVLMLFA